MADLSIIKKNFIKYVDSIIDHHKVSHAYLVEVNNYEDDLSYVYHFIKMILCDLSFEDVDQSDNPIIHQIDTNNYPDITVVSSDTSVINKSLILDLQKEFSNKSLMNGKRIYIIKEAEKLNGYSANTILKFLEDPEDDIIAFLITDSRYHVIDTILSRCQILSLKDDPLISETNDRILDFIDCILHLNSFFMKYHYYIDDLFIDKSAVIEHLFITENIFVCYLENAASIDQTLYDLLCSVDQSTIIHILSIIEDEVPKLNFNVNFKLWCDSFFSKLIGGVNYD